MAEPITYDGFCEAGAAGRQGAGGAAAPNADKLLLVQVDWATSRNRSSRASASTIRRSSSSGS